MKRCMIFLIGFIFLFTLTTIAAATQTTSATTKEAPAKEKVVKRQKTGKILKISDTHLTLTFKKKGVQEQDTMEFILSSPEKLQRGERVTVFYVEKDGKKEALRIKIKEDNKDSKKKSSP